MQSLKKIIDKNLQRISVAVMILILLIAILLHIMMVQSQTRDNAHATFLQIEQILQENKEELSASEANYRETCLLNAQAVAYMIQYNPAIIGDIQEFRAIAELLQVDEIHLFDTTGRIFTGTHPEYYDMTFESGEQIGFFKPLLKDKSLELCQDITPNTAEGKAVQYSARWSSDGKFIVQIGMYPDAVLAATEKNELSYIFSLLQGHPGVDFYAIDSASGVIIGSTNESDNGKSFSQLGFDMSRLDHYIDGIHATVNGVDSYCVFADLNGTLIAYIIANDVLYNTLPSYITVLVLGLAIITLLFIYAIRKFTTVYIIDSISDTNKKLRSISEGELDERVEVSSSIEFHELSSHINDMVKSLRENIDKMSLVLNRTNLNIGVYEYNKNLRTVRFTERIPDILSLDAETIDKLSANHTLFSEYIDGIRCHPAPEGENIFSINGTDESYIKLDETSVGNDILGIIIDVTDEIITRRKIEAERDIDLLTGLYNRRGIERRLEELFSGNDIGHGALIMIDSDDLKTVNDTFGHPTGDLYLKHIAHILRDFGCAEHISARLSGDEFLVLLYGYSTTDEVLADLNALHLKRNSASLSLDGGKELPVRFSYGYVLTKDQPDYLQMIKEADSYMYEVKRQRKRAAVESKLALL